ncbi:MAG: hypothetical protein HQL15_06155 [Candidatus Omnitrophica bacterium]|nr:hypothetical protein [Candidatus Omnitrophota bacterium]
MSGFIGIGAFVVLVSLFSFRVSELYAANPYQLGQVDYFHKQSSAQDEKQEIQSFDWREPMVLADGKTTYYSPPAPVLALLENPTPENAKLYLNWQKQKLIKITQAQKVLDQVIKEGTKG